MTYLAFLCYRKIRQIYTSYKPRLRSVLQFTDQVSSVLIYGPSAKRTGLKE